MKDGCRERAAEAQALQAEFKIPAVWVNEQEGSLVKGVAESLCIRPFLFPGWGKAVRDVVLGGDVGLVKSGRDGRLAALA